MNKFIKVAEVNEDIRINRLNIGGSSNVTIPDSFGYAVAFFAIVGLIVIVAWVLYAITYLYDITTGNTKYRPWYRLSVKSKTILNNSFELDFERKAVFTSLQLGLASLKEDYSFLGLVTEVGNHQITDKNNGVEVEYNGPYFMLGPSIALGDQSGDVVTLDLMGGVSDHNDVTLLGEAALNWNINLNQTAKKFAPTLNLSFGANYLSIK
jgi:hypothetical protein